MVNCDGGRRATRRRPAVSTALHPIAMRTPPCLRQYCIQADVDMPCSCCCCAASACPASPRIACPPMRERRFAYSRSSCPPPTDTLILSPSVLHDGSAMFSSSRFSPTRAGCTSLRASLAGEFASPLALSLIGAALTPVSFLLCSHARSGHVATVFGCTGFLGRYVVSKLGEPRLCSRSAR